MARSSTSTLSVLRKRSSICARAPRLISSAKRRVAPSTTPSKSTRPRASAKPGSPAHTWHAASTSACNARTQRARGGVIFFSEVTRSHQR